ncbi:unnamed protein product [Paramecium octaurelia]|uniref:Uncharacterized protein n=1 Tax=Paramecium octaurelia TaxID=43137 RepID=A0A8S1YC04_PAROT|nr:unnamed protein product [Paramecium octaurelia]
MGLEELILITAVSFKINNTQQYKNALYICNFRKCHNKLIADYIRVGLLKKRFSDSFYYMNIKLKKNGDFGHPQSN